MSLTLAAPPFMSRLFGAAPALARPRVTRWFATRVRQGTTQEIAPPPGAVTVHCRGGEAWITHDGDPRDVLLKQDESYVVDRSARMTAFALRGDCGLEMQQDF